MVTGQELIKLVLLVGIAYWVLMLSKQLWYYCQVKPKQILILLLQDQEDIIEGLVYYLKLNQHKIEINRWEVVLVNLESQDRTGEILQRVTNGNITNLSVVTMSRQEKQEFLHKMTELNHKKPILALTMTRKIDCRNACEQIGRIIVNEYQPYQSGEFEL